MSVSYKPEGHHTITPYLLTKDAAKLLQFLKEAFDAVETEKLTKEDGSIMHAQVRIGDSQVMMGQTEDKAMPCMIYIYVPDADATYKQALAAGATSYMEPADQFYGDRAAAVNDVSGNQWWIATHMEAMSSEELQKRAIEARG